MLAKLVAHGRTRAEALDRLRDALDATVLLGVRTNVRFLRWLLDQAPMRDGEMRTDSIAGLELPREAIPGERHWRAAAALLAPTNGDPWGDGWRLNGDATRRLRHGEDERTVSQAPPDDPPAAAREGDTIHVDVEGQSLEFRAAPPPTIEEAVRNATAGGDGSAALVAPMPGRVIAVRAQEGETVHAHQAVVIIEAMKMEHAVVAPSDGTVVSLAVREGQQVQRGDVLGEVSPYHGDDG
jgi:acetyl/propionyl-CoA carboxylase alpha subunit